MRVATAASVRFFDALEVTGRARTHVVGLEGLRCTLHPQAASAFVAIREAAAADGIDLRPASSFRDFGRQSEIWNEKFRGERTMLDRSGCAMDGQCLAPAERVEAILWWSALPGASRHHWGTDLDVFDRAAIAPGTRVHLTPAEFGPDGPFARLDAWLQRHMSGFGFYRPYASDHGGVSPEAWHISYAPVAAVAFEALTLPVLEQAIAQSAIEGRDAILARLAGIRERYVCQVDAAPAAALAARWPALAPATPADDAGPPRSSPA